MTTPTQTRTTTVPESPVILDATLESMAAETAAAESMDFSGLLSAAKSESAKYVTKGNDGSVDPRYAAFAESIIRNRHNWDKTSHGNRAFSLAVWPVADPKDKKAPLSRATLQPVDHDAWIKTVYPAFKFAINRAGLVLGAKSGQIRVSGVSGPDAKTERNYFTFTVNK